LHEKPTEKRYGPPSPEGIWQPVQFLSTSASGTVGQDWLFFACRFAFAASFLLAAGWIQHSEMPSAKPVIIQMSRHHSKTAHSNHPGKSTRIARLIILIIPTTIAALARGSGSCIPVLLPGPAPAPCIPDSGSKCCLLQIARFMLQAYVVVFNTNLIMIAHAAARLLRCCAMMCCEQPAMSLKTHER